MSRNLPRVIARAPIPSTTRDILDITRRCRRLVTRRALVSAGAAVVPIPGLDIAVDIRMLLQMIDEVNAEFGLTPMQLERLSPKRKLFAYKSITLVGSTLIGRIITRDMLLVVLKKVGVRLTAAQVAKYVPLAGQAVAASLSFAALKYLGDQHVADCARVAEMMIDVTPPPAPAANPRAPASAR